MNARARLRGLHGLLRRRPGDREAINAYQSACLRPLVRHAFARIPHYKRVFDKLGIKPEDIRSASDLSALPILTREELQQLDPADICTPGVDLSTLRTVHTSGSTGEPLVVRRSMFEERLLLAFRARAVGAWGVGLRASRANIDHMSPDVVAVENGEFLYERFGIMPRLQLDWRTPVDGIVEAIERFQPQIVSGPPSLLSWVAADLTNDDRRRIPARLALVGGENVTSQMREDITGGFGTPVASIYGSHEVVFIAMEVPGQSGYRVCEEAVIVEVLRNGAAVAPGETGEMVVTALHSFTQPFIRYRLGDVVTLGHPLEGEHGPYTTLASIDGRSRDKFILPDGRELLGYSLGEVIETSGLKVRRFRITQHARNVFRVELALYGEPGAQLAHIEQRMLSILGTGVRVEVDVHPRLEQTTRKFYPFIPYERLETWGAQSPR